MDKETGLPNYINKLTLHLQPGYVIGPDNEVAVLDRGKTLGEWMLRYDGRIRWGRAAEIEEDIDHFETFGKLPERVVGGF